jgi:mycothiol synthase
VEQHDDVIATRDDVEARVLAGDDGVDDAIALLDAAEADLEVPLVDEAERERLHALAAGTTPRARHWHSLLARRGPTAVGYAGVLLPEAPGLPATGDVAVARTRPPCGPVLSVLLAGLEGLAWRHAAGDLEVWIRHAAPDDVTCATDEGYGVRRRLGVLGRDLDDLAPDAVSDAEVAGLDVRPYRPDVDDAGVVAVLAAAYAGTDDGGWDLARLRERRGWSWFDPGDLLVVVDERGWIAGIHWLKRRTATSGEVYNLAIHPDAQGRGLGALLLAAGLAHLRERGCDEVLLWVDLANERAVRLYTSQGFSTRWEDVALGRTLRGGGRTAA